MQQTLQVRCEAFSAALVQGQKPELEAHLRSCPKELRLRLFPLLLKLELLHFQKAGQPVASSHYHRRFPKLAAVIDQVIESLPQDFKGTLSQPSQNSTNEDTLAIGADQVQTDRNLPSLEHRYEKQRELGRGTFGCVWLARDRQLGRLVAIKEPHPERLDAPGALEEYLSEAQVLAELDHPHIVPVYDFGRSPAGTCFVVSKYIDGESLASRLARQPLAIPELVDLLAKVAEALQHIHNLGLVHRDIKPGNILLDRRGEPFIADFGLAIRDDQMSLQQSLAGTPAYMSPEQVRGEGHRVDGRSDLFSLGVIFYEVLTGRRPFVGKSLRELFQQITHEDPSPPRELHPEIPQELERVCLKLLSKRPSDRYASAEALVADLRNWKQASVKRAIPRVRPMLVPKGLRSFDQADSEFFLDLLPGPKDRDGLSEVLRFWKSRIEQTDSSDPLKVGLIYGPSGCGKSSLIKAGLLPRLSERIHHIAIEAAPDQTEDQVLHAIRRTVPDAPQHLSLSETLAHLRRGRSLAAGRKLLIVIDHFEQWLHAHARERFRELTLALRQCDGDRVSAVLLVRDDFWAPASRFMQELEVPILEGVNAWLVDLFDLRHAERVLGEFGKAYGCLPQDSTQWTVEQKDFLKQAVVGIAQEDRVVCVRLSLLADMMKCRPWTLKELRRVGGVTGLGTVFLEETFCGPQSTPILRQNLQRIQSLLRSLLPAEGEQIKGRRATLEQLKQASHWSSNPESFAMLMRTLDRDLRIIAPVDQEGNASSLDQTPVKSSTQSAPLSYQLTHDYLVPSLRDWLNRKQRETRRGRAELRLSERAEAWSLKQDHRHLPSLLEWMQILRSVPRGNWTVSQQAVMSAAGRRHLLRWGSSLLATLVLLVGTQIWLYQQARRIEEVRVAAAVDTLQGVSGNAIPLAIENLRALPKELVQTELATRWQTEANPQRRLSLAYANADVGAPDIAYLIDRIATISPTEFRNLVTALSLDVDRSLPALREAAAACIAPETWRTKARLATIEGELGGSVIAQAMADHLDGSEVGEREVLIDEYAKFIDSPSHTSERLSQIENISLSTALALAMGQMPNSFEPGSDQPLLKWAETIHISKDDRLLHSVSGWVLRRAQRELQPESQSSAPDARRDWYVNSLGMTLLRVKPGSFQQEAESNRWNESREVQIPYEFWLADREVTAAAFQQFQQNSGYRAVALGPESELVEPEITRTPQHPVHLVSTSDAIEFCNWLSLKEGFRPFYERVVSTSPPAPNAGLSSFWKLVANSDGYRLPMEEEWEYACRAGTQSLYSCGNDIEILRNHAVLSALSTEPAGSKLPNHWGFFDMHGNVQEWCIEPTDMAQELMPMRGGSFLQLPGVLESRFRTPSPFYSAYDGFGFRIARGSRPDISGSHTPE